MLQRCSAKRPIGEYFTYIRRFSYALHPDVDSSLRLPRGLLKELVQRQAVSPSRMVPNLSSSLVFSLVALLLVSNRLASRLMCPRAPCISAKRLVAASPASSLLGFAPKCGLERACLRERGPPWTRCVVPARPAQGTAPFSDHRRHPMGRSGQQRFLRK